MNNLIQITQDGCCILDINSPRTHGFFTQKIESCVVYIFRTKMHWIAVHDSGQLNIRKLYELINSCGNVQKMYAIYGKKRISSYKQRNEKIRKKLKYDKKIEEVFIELDEFDLFVTFYNLNIKYSISQKENQNLYFIPEISKVNSIINLNNAFIELGSESLPVDLQYTNNSFIRNTKLLHSLEYIIGRIKDEYEFREINIQIMKEAIDSGAIILNDEQKQIIGLS